ncbi:hypothetical protein Bca4012_010281 [Brassica carinata]
MIKGAGLGHAPVSYLKGRIRHRAVKNIRIRRNRSTNPPVRTEGECAIVHDGAGEGGHSGGNKPFPERSPASTPHAAKNQKIYVRKIFCCQDVQFLKNSQKNWRSTYQPKCVERSEKFDCDQIEAIAGHPTLRSMPR